MYYWIESSPNSVPLNCATIKLFIVSVRVPFSRARNWISANSISRTSPLTLPTSSHLNTHCYHCRFVSLPDAFPVPRMFQSCFPQLPFLRLIPHTQQPYVITRNSLVLYKFIKILFSPLAQTRCNAIPKILINYHNLLMW